MRDSLGRYRETASLLKRSLSLLLMAAAVRPAGAQSSASTRQFPIPFAIPSVVNEARMIDSSYVGDAMAYKYRAPSSQTHHMIKDSDGRRHACTVAFGHQRFVASRTSELSRFEGGGVEGRGPVPGPHG
jgi:hypothetical protein